jgi:hypothetical protein
VTHTILSLIQNSLYSIRFVCMDYCVFSTLGATANGIKSITLSYDIACLWSVHFWKRLGQTYDELYKLLDDATITFAVLKFHLEAHGKDCKSRFNLNFTKGAARTCGEGIEAGWADMNAIGVFTHEHSATHRHEVIEDFMQAINFCKIKTMGALNLLFYSNPFLPFLSGKTLLRQLREAITMSKTQSERFEKFEATIPLQHVVQWENLIKEWDNAKDKKHTSCPYCEPVQSV